MSLFYNLGTYEQEVPRVAGLPKAMLVFANLTEGQVPVLQICLLFFLLLWIFPLFPISRYLSYHHSLSSASLLGQTIECLIMCGYLFGLQIVSFPSRCCCLCKTSFTMLGSLGVLLRYFCVRNNICV